LEEPRDGVDTPSLSSVNGLKGRIRLAAGAFAGDVRSGGDGESFRVTLDRVGVGEARLAMVFGVRSFGVRGAGDTISTNTRGSWEGFEGAFFDLLPLVTFLVGNKTRPSSD